MITCGLVKTPLHACRGRLVDIDTHKWRLSKTQIGSFASMQNLGRATPARSAKSDATEATMAGARARLALPAVILAYASHRMRTRRRMQTRVEQHTRHRMHNPVEQPDPRSSPVPPSAQARSQPFRPSPLPAMLRHYIPAPRWMPQSRPPSWAESQYPPSCTACQKVRATTRSALLWALPTPRARICSHAGAQQRSLPICLTA